MASSSGSQYGNYNPAAVDPYPIEQTLAAEAVKGNPRANTMLDLYQLQRQAGSNLYGQELDKQHDFNRQQLAQQLYEANMKSGAEYGKIPGGARMLANSGFYGNLGFSQEGATGLADASDRAQTAVDLSHSGTGLSGLTTAGFQPSSEQAAAATGGLAGPQGDPTAIAAAKIRANATMAAARLHASSQSDPHPGESLPYQDPSGAMGTLSRGKLNDAQWEAAKRAHGILPMDQSGQIKPSPLPAQQGATNVPPAQQAPPAQQEQQATPQPGTGKQQNTAPNEAAISKRIVEFLHNPASKVPAEKRDDIMRNAARNNGQVVRTVDPNNPGKGLQIQGASGKYY